MTKGGPRGERKGEATHSLEGGLRRLASLARQVREGGACSMPGVSIQYDLFVSKLRVAVQRGQVDPGQAEFVRHGLWHGFDLGLDVAKLPGRIRFKK